MKNQKGITLVALIITIIVMLILAGVSISLVVGDNGVLTQAQSTETASLKGALRDAINMANGVMVADFYANSTGRTKAIDSDQLDEYIKANYSGGSSASITIDGTIPTAAGNATVTVKLVDVKTVELQVKVTKTSDGYYQFSDVIDTAA